MSQQSYLIDTNILIGLEDYRTVEAAYARFHALASAHKVGIYVHEAAKDDISRDKDAERRKISLSKIEKYRLLKKQRGLKEADLEAAFGPLKKPNDVVDATLLHALEKGVADFLVTQDKGFISALRTVRLIWRDAFYSSMTPPNCSSRPTYPKRFRSAT